MELRWIIVWYACTERRNRQRHTDKKPEFLVLLAVPWTVLVHRTHESGWALQNIPGICPWHPISRPVFTAGHNRLNVSGTDLELKLFSIFAAKGERGALSAFCRTQMVRDSGQHNQGTKKNLPSRVCAAHRHDRKVVFMMDTITKHTDSSSINSSTTE